MNKYFAVLVGSAVIAFSVSMTGCTMPNQNPNNVLNLSDPSYTTGDSSWWTVLGQPHKLPAIHFAWNSTVIHPTWYGELNNLAAGLKAHPKAVASLIGFTDGTGDPSYNQHLGYKRAQTIAQYLRAQGVSSSQIRVATAGQHHPVANDLDSVGQYMNRRVDIIVMPR